MLKHIRLAAVIVALLALTTETAFARGGSRASAAGRTVHVRSYYRQDGTFVPSYNRSAPGSGTRSTNASNRTASNTLSNADQLFSTPAVVTKQVTTTKPSTITATTASKTTTPLSTTASTTSSVNTSTPTQTTVVTNPLGITPYVSVPISLNPDAVAQRTYGPTLHNARQLIKAGLYPQAADYLRRIINGAPGTRIANEAQRLLASLP